jgi:L-ascorbate metabolism protein UlaG (beta-lactamase superfamily)
VRRLPLLLVALVAACGGPSAAHAALPAETVTAREHYFGAENVAPDGTVRDDRVILSWFSVASVAAALDGHVVLLDAYIHKEEDLPNYVPTTTDELVALAPEAIFIGHGHFDHAATGGEIIARTGAFLVGTPEHCDQAKQQAAAYAGQAVDVRCIDAVTRASEVGREVNELRPFDDRIEVTAFKHVHSAAEAPDGENHETTLGSAPVPDARLVLLHPPGPSVLSNLAASGDEGSSILYQFRLGDFSLTWHDTAGPLRERAPHVFDLLKGLPATDVEVGAVLGFNDPTNGLRDVVDYVERVRPQVFFPVHHDFVAEYGASQRMKGVMEREMARRGELPTELRWLYDPQDYLRPSLMTFDPLDVRWAPGEDVPPVIRRCMRRKLRVRPRGIGFVRIGVDWAQLMRSANTSRTPRSLRFCVGLPPDEAVAAVYAEDRRVRLIRTTARGHRTRGIGARSRVRTMKRRYRRSRPLGDGLVRASPASRIVFGTRRGRVRFVAVADRELIANTRRLRAYLRLAR